MTEPYISKSKYIAGLQCPKLLWTYYNDKSVIPEPDAGTQAIFEQGHLVGELATSLFPNGIMIDWTEDFAEMAARSKAALQQRKPVYEASFIHDRAFARADILNPISSGNWDLIEVKSSTEVKDVHLEDVAFQKYVYEGAGVPIQRCYLMHIDNSYVRQGEADAGKLFKKEDVTKQISSMLAAIPEQVSTMRDLISSSTCPAANLGDNCDSPYPCPLKDSCWSFLPERSVFSLNNARGRGMKLMNAGILELKDIPENFSLTEKQEIQVACERSGEPFIDRKSICEFLNCLKYPLYFLDFETFMTAIPVYDLVRPYQQVPFQYSLHILRTAKPEPEHIGFLSDGKSDPRPEILSRLKNELGTYGSIVAYNSAFEKRILRESAAYFPEYCNWVEELSSRIVDLLVPFKSFSYYHPDQLGSASLKAVLPVLTGQSYDDLEISDGGTASLRYLDMAFGNFADTEQRSIRNRLDIYCSQDTRGMIDIVHALKNMV